jgi:hypothetical protein
MDNKPTPPSEASSAERPSGINPEGLQASSPDLAPQAEAAPAATPADNSGGAAAVGVPPTLSADDVAAALSAVPGAAPVSPTQTPSVAGDVDVIEPEWVDKVEEVVQAHQGDPYGEEEAVEDVQRDYLKKRYGYTVADPNGETSKPEGK